MRRAVRAALALLVAAIATSALGASVVQAATLPDGRGYEFVTPGLNNAALYGPAAIAAPDGSALQFQTIDAPLDSSNGSVANPVIARRGPQGWSTKSALSPAPGPTGSFFGVTGAASQDFLHTLNITEQQLSATPAPLCESLYYGNPDGSYELMTPREGTCGYSPFVAWASTDFSHLFFWSTPQLEEPAAFYGNYYEWSKAGGLKLIGILPGPGHNPAPGGGEPAFPPGHSGSERPAMDPVSADGEELLWTELGGGTLYLREHGSNTVEPTASQRTIEPDPNPPAPAASVGVNQPGTEAFFISHSELTNDAFTGRSGGVSTDAGADLYSYDIQTGKLNDLTVDRKPEDEATGANVTDVVGASKDGSYIYFTATGNLAPGGDSGASNLYVEHDGSISLIATEPGFAPRIGIENGFYVTPDGRHAAFLSVASLTGYDNVNPSTGQQAGEVFAYTYGGNLVCASCRPDGTPPTGSATFGESFGGAFARAVSVARVVSDDGSRVFFQSDDAILPGASNGLSNVYEYEDGQIHLLSDGSGNSPSLLMDASASGDDVFIATHDELVPTRLGEVTAIYDARVGAAPGDLAPPARCSGATCLGVSNSPPGSLPPGSAGVRQDEKLVAYRYGNGQAGRFRLAISVPGTGRLSVSGKGLKKVVRKVAQAGVVRLEVALLKGANRTRMTRGFSSEARVELRPTSGATQRTAISLRFAAGNTKGGK
jgi:hypothetical protein